MAEFDQLPAAEMSHYLDNAALPELESADRLVSVLHCLPALAKEGFGEMPFLQADPKLLATLKARIHAARLKRRKKYLCGLSWRSTLSDRDRTLQAVQWELIEHFLKMDDVLWVNCQYDQLSPTELEFFSAHSDNFISLDDVDQFNDIDAAAALYATLDLMVSAGTFTAALAAIMGVTTLVPSPGRPMGKPINKYSRAHVIMAKHVSVYCPNAKYYDFFLEMARAELNRVSLASGRQPTDF